MRKLILAGAIALAFAPATALAAEKTPSPEDLAKASCKTQKAELGAKVFKQTHKAKSMSKAMKACMGVTEDTAADELKNAAQECKAARDADPAAFGEEWAANKNGKNAYGKCVSATVKVAMDEETEAVVNAARTCKAMKADDAATFEATYGTKKNAFGKCVSAHAKAQHDES